MGGMSDPIAAARALLAEDPDPETRAELQALVARVEGGDEAARRDLADRFTGPLEFGTAGLRGRVEAGLARMNRLAVIKATWGFGSHLLQASGAEAKTRGVVVGFDGRHSSRAFAEDAASVLAGLGIPVRLLPDPVPTPLLSFSVPHLGAAAGVAVTASHNPPRDNGYKVYLPTGAQLLAPVDAAIAARIGAAPRLDAIARPSAADAAAFGLRLLVDVEDAAVEEGYLDGLAEGALHAEAAVPLRLAYTAMHGVGHRLAVRALARAGFEGVAVVPDQADPDGAFRTVAFPNPEEPGAMDRVLALAAATGCSAATRPASSSPTTRSSTRAPAAGGSWSSRPSSPRASSHEWRATAASPTGRPSPASSGSATRRCARRRKRGSRSSSATRKRSATPSARSCATRTASARPCASPRQRATSRHAAARCSIASTSCSSPTASRTRCSGRSRCPGPRAARGSPPPWRGSAAIRCSGSAAARSCGSSTPRRGPSASAEKRGRRACRAPTCSRSRRTTARASRCGRAGRSPRSSSTSSSPAARPTPRRSPPAARGSTPRARR